MSSPESNAGKLSSPRSWESRLRNYALAAGAAGVGLLSLSKPAQASVVFTPADMTLTLGNMFIDIDGDGSGDFVLSENWFDFPSSQFPLLRQLRLVVGGTPGAGVVLSGKQAAVLPPGAEIGSSDIFRTVNPAKLQMAFGNSVYTTSAGTCCFFGYGRWNDVNNMFLGLRFFINGQTHYGWAQVSVKSNDGSQVGKRFLLGTHLTGYAYETVGGKSIIAGQRTAEAADSSQVQPGSLGALAQGAARRNRDAGNPTTGK